MRALRRVHAVTVLLAGLVVVLLIYGSVRLAVATLTLVICLQAWSSETLRVLLGQRENK